MDSASVGAWPSVGASVSAVAVGLAAAARKPAPPRPDIEATNNAPTTTAATASNTTSGPAMTGDGRRAVVPDGNARPAPGGRRGGAIIAAAEAEPPPPDIPAMASPGPPAIARAAAEAATSVPVSTATVGLDGSGVPIAVSSAVGHRAPVRIASKRIGVQGADDDRVEGGRDLRADGPRRRGGAADPGGGEGRRRVAAPRPPAGQRFVEDEAQAVDVGGGRRRRPGRLLRAEVVDGAERRARDRALGIGGQSGDPEVRDHRPAVARQQDVAGLHVAVDDAADVGDAERARHVETDPGRLRRRPGARPGADEPPGLRPRSAP